MKYIIMMGTIEDGFEFVGPFDSRDEAREAASHITRHAWAIHEMVAFDKDNLPMLESDLQRMYSNSK